MNTNPLAVDGGMGTMNFNPDHSLRGGGLPMLAAGFIQSRDLGVKYTRSVIRLVAINTKG